MLPHVGVLAASYRSWHLGHYLEIVAFTEDVGGYLRLAVLPVIAGDASYLPKSSAFAGVPGH